MTYDKLIDWCYKKFAMNKQQPWNQKSTPASRLPKASKRSHFPDLEHDLFAWVCRCESSKACLTDDTIIEKAKANLGHGRDTWTR